MKTLFVGHHLVELYSVGSTNDYCWELLSKGNVLDGTLVWAHAQLKGKGQRGHSWQVAAGEALPLSIVRHPKEHVKHQFYLNKSIALGVCEALASFGVLAQVKWPNDIYVQHQKLAGILIENNLRGHLLQSSVVGVGVNVNQTQFENTLLNPVSLRQSLGYSLPLNDVLEELCYYIEKRYLQFKARRFQQIDSDYHAVLYKKEQLQSFKKEGTIFDAKIIGVTEEGKIKLLNQGETSVYNMGEVEFVIKAP